MRLFIACISILLLLTSFACSRELRSGDDTPQQPFNFERIPESENPSSFYTEDPVQETTGQTEVVNGDETPDETTPPADDPTLAPLLNQGRDSIMMNDWEGAIEIFLQVIERDEENVSALYNLGLSYRRLQDYPNAIKYSSMAADVDPDRLYVHQGLGRAYLESGDVESAMAAFEEELDRHPDEPNLAGVAFDLARLKLDNGLHEEAFDAAMKAVTMKPEEHSYRAILGEVHLANGANEEALDQFMAALDIAPDAAIYRKFVGDALWNLDRKDEARQQYNDAITLDSSIRDEIPAERLEDDASSETENILDAPL